MGNITGDDAVFTNISGALSTTGITAQGTNLTIDPNGFLFVDTDNMYVGSLTQATHITGTTIGSVGTPVTITSGDILPAAHLTYDLGSPTQAWHSAYVGPGSLYIDGQKVLGSDASGDIDITTDSGQNLHISSGADVKILPQLGETGQGFVVELDRVELGYDGDSTTTITGTLEAPDLHIGDLEIDPTLINNTGTNQNLEIRTNGTGYVHINTADLYVGPLTGAVKIDESSISTTDATQLTIEGFTNSADMTTAINTAETNANDYTDTREIAITSAYQTYADQAEADAITTSNSYADTAISNLVDSAPATLDTLNELAAALGDDANFSTTVTNSIATKWTQDNTKISNWDTAYSWGDHSVEGYLTSYTETDPIFIGHVASSITSTEITNWNNAYGWGDHSLAGYLTSYTETDPVFTASPANGITSTNISNWNTAYGWGDHSIVGYLTDYTVTEADVTQHQAALSITESQISDLTHFTTADARTAISLNSSNVNELSYDSTTGVFSYTSPTTVTAVGQVVFDVRNTSGVAISRGDAVYIAGNSGGKILVAKSDSNVAATMPAIGLANTAMNNNTDGTVLISGEMTSIDTSAFSEGDVLYVSETAGELTATRPSSASTKIQNIGKVARSDNQNGVIIVSGSGRANDVPNLDHLNVFIGNAGGVEQRQLNTSDVTENASYLYYTDGRVQSVIDTNTAGFITDYTVTESDVTAHQAALSITESQISDLDHYTNADFDTQLATKSTSDLTEGSNLYYTDGRVLNWFGTVGLGMLSTDVIPEGSSNLYYTDNRVNNWFGTVGLPALQASALTMSENFAVSLGDSSTVIGDALIADTYDTHGFKINADDTNWAGITLEEYVGGANKPLVSGFANATVAAQVFGGTPSAKTNVISGKRLLTIQGLAANQSDGTLPAFANFRIKGETTEDQTTSNRGTKLTFESTANGSNTTTETLKLTGNQVTVNSDGDGYLNSGGDLYLNDDVKVTGTLDVDGATNLKGNVTLGDANTDVITSTGKFKASNGFKNTVLDTATANYLSGVLGIVEVGDQAYISDGNGGSGSPCMAFYDGSNWKRMHSPADNISST